MKPILVTAAELESDPHRTFKFYRPLTPFIQREDSAFVAIRAADVEQLITDPRTRQMETESVRARGASEGALFDFFDNSMLMSNGPTHRKRRAPFSRAFALRVVNDLRSRIRELMNDILDDHHARGEMRFLEEFAARVPARITADMLGIAPADIPEFTQNVYRLAQALTPTFTSADIPGLNTAAGSLTRYVEELLEQRRYEPREDLLTSYLHAVEESEALSRIETLIQVVTVILAGSDTTRAALTIQLSLLMQHREQWDAMRADPSLIKGAVLESLRYEPAVGSIPRVTLEDIEIDEVTVPRHSMLSMSTLSALRDPAAYPEPDHFDITRDHPRRSMVFGGGSHRCLGETLALIELEEALATLAERVPDIRLVNGPPAVSGSGGIRRVGEMAVRW